MVTLEYGVRCPINGLFTDELIWEIPSWLVPVSDDENVTIYKLYSNIENADILLIQCPEKRRKQPYIYAKIRTGSAKIVYYVTA